MAQLLKKRKYHITTKKLKFYVLLSIPYVQKNISIRLTYCSPPEERSSIGPCSGLDVNKQGFERESRYVE